MNWTKAIKQHYVQNWKAEPEFCRFERGPIHKLPTEFAVLIFPPQPQRMVWSYGTCGMSLSSDADPIELHLFSPIKSEAIVELLYAVAHFHRTGSKLNLWHTVNFGQPWLGSSQCEFGLVSLPYLDGPDLENFEFDNRKVKFYWLIPITRAELELKKTGGVEALEARFDESGFDYADPTRKSVV